MCSDNDSPPYIDFPNARRCEARIGWDRGEGRELIPVYCKRSIGVRVMVDSTGTKRFVCPIPGHVVQVTRMHGELVPA